MPGVLGVDARRGVGIASVVAGAIFTAVGALDWGYAFVWNGAGPFCSGNTCYQTIAEPTPWYFLVVLPAGLIVLLTGVLLLARRGQAGPLS
jgi:hypothetical protein